MFDGIAVPQREWPSGYAIRVTRYADAMLRDAFPEHWADVLHVLTTFRIDAVVDIGGPGGNRSPLVKRFDGLLEACGWGKQRMELTTAIREVGRNGQTTRSARNHEMDMFKRGAPERFPRVAVEMEWNNKDPFFDRDLTNYYTLHRAGALAVGVMVTRGSDLQAALSSRNCRRFGASTTHWAKLMACIDVGGGGECPLILLGIGRSRVDGL